ncbi:MAG: FAD-dependent oxidoreductase, partial [Acutalibacteraceae bacterium]|nr:FAD-dependent oxidoreductase [Acutalibacteraceae bacterium]
FNPLKFLAGIAQNLHIYEHTRMLETAGSTAICEGGRISAQKIVAATHFPLSNKRGAYFLKMYQNRSYVLALQNAADVHGIYRDVLSSGLSVRNYGNLLLLGGGAARTGKTCGWDYVEKAAARYYPNSHVFCRYAAQDCMTVDDLPYVGHYSKNTPNWYVITGFNKWGMTNAMAGASIIKDMILGKQNDYAAAFSPSRCYVRSQLFANAAHAVGNIVKPTVKRCPHLGCALIRNKAEHSWDCPCHGSRFSDDGKLLDTPAQGDLKK